MGQRGNKVLLSLFALDKSCLNINSIERIKILCRRLDIRVPQVVEPGLGTADRGHNGLVCPLDGVQVQVSPRLGGEHQPAVLPHRPQLQPLFCLLGPVALQELHHKGGGGDGTRPVVFQRGENVLAALLPLQLELFVNEDGPTGEVDAIPAQPHDLPLRRPVNRVKVNSASRGWPWMAARKALQSSSSMGLISFFTMRGSIQASEGLKRR